MKARQALLLSCAAALCAAAPLAPAAEIGLGAAFNDGATVLLPIRTDSWLIEPELDFSSSSTAANGGVSNQSTSIGAGLYSRKEIGPLFETYVGARVAYQMGKTHQGTNEGKINGWQLAPTIGVQHFFSKQFSIGVDAGLRYSSTEFKQTSPVSTTDHVHNWDSVARILVRAFFW